MKLLIKVGGTLLDHPASRGNLAGQLAAASREHQLAVVHGGGKQMTRFLEERGIPSRFVNGLRVSDAMVVDAATKVIAGSVNKQFVSALLAAGTWAVGLSGVDGLLTSATQLDPALGFVGQPQETNAALLNLLVEAGYLPVVACLAGDRLGNIFNINADQMAVSCAVAFQAEKLFFLTDVPGVKGADGERLARLTATEAAALIGSGVAHGGMQAKLEAAAWALRGGVSEVVIAAGQEPDVCRRLLAAETLGTRLVPGSIVSVSVPV